MWFDCVQIDQEGLTLPERSLYLGQDEDSVKVNVFPYLLLERNLTTSISVATLLPSISPSFPLAFFSLYSFFPLLSLPVGLHLHSSSHPKHLFLPLAHT